MVICRFSMSSISFVVFGAKLGNKLLITKLFGKKVIKKRKILLEFAFFAYNYVTLWPILRKDA